MSPLLLLVLVALASYVTTWVIRQLLRSASRSWWPGGARLVERKPVSCDICMSVWTSLPWSGLAFVPMLPVLGWWTPLLVGASAGLALLVLRGARLVACATETLKAVRDSVSVRPVRVKTPEAARAAFGDGDLFRTEMTEVPGGAVLSYVRRDPETGDCPACGAAEGAEHDPGCPVRVERGRSQRRAYVESLSAVESGAASPSPRRTH